jgi:hypothetical protein
VVSRLAAVLSAFSVDHEELTLTAISHRSELPLVTARRLLGELVNEQLVERLPSGPVPDRPSPLGDRLTLDPSQCPAKSGYSRRA